MIKRKIIETVEEYSIDGKLLNRTTTETEETEEAPYRYPYVSTLPWPISTQWLAPCNGIPVCGDYPATQPNGGMGGSEPPEKGSV